MPSSFPPSPFALHLLSWFRENRRELPWRETTDPYAVWLSEIILQQTQVNQGMAYWERFMHRWPTVEELAAATEDEVLREWQGLGYYSRARNLHAASRQVVALGGFPQTVEGLRALKGVGDYTAAAIGSIAVGLPAAVVDGNVYRVLSRHFGISTPVNTTEGKREFTELAQSLLPTGPATEADGYGRVTSLSSAYNQAIMDFGALQCTPQSPTCMSCPLQETCVALREDRIGELPVKLRKLKVRERRLAYIYIRCKGMTAIHRRGPGDIWQGLWEPVISEPPSPITLRLSPSSPLPSPIKRNVRHVLTHQVILADFYLLETQQRPTLPPDYVWIREEDIDRYAVPRLVELLIEAVGRESAL